MKFKHFALFATAATVLAGCDGNSKLDAPEQFGENDILVSIEDINGTKSALSDDVKTIWSNGDIIKVYSYDNSTSKLDSAEYAFSEDVEPGLARFLSSTASDGFSISKFAAAYYPGENAVSYNPIDSKITASIASSQTYAANSFGVDAAPMASNVLDNSGSTPEIRFRNAFAVIKLNLTGTSKISEIRVSAPSLTTATALSGTFNFELGSENAVTVSKSNANDAGYELVLDCSSSATLTSTPTPFYIAVPGMPTGTKMAVSIAGGIGVVKKFTTVTGSTGNALVQNNIVNMPELNTKQPDGCLPGLFSVSATKQVYFSPGNLQATYHTSSKSYTWGFAEHQYDYIGNAQGNTTIGSQIDGAVVDLFGWVGASSALNGDYEKYGISTNDASNNTIYGTSDADALKNDWGTAIDNIGTWYTMSDGEWTYLLTNRTSAESKVGYATVAGKKGIIILPDSFTDPMKNDGSKAFVPKSTTGYTANIYTTGGNWEAMESAGAVFLPAAGARDGSSLTSTDEGRYWSSTAGTTVSAWRLSFKSTEIKVESGSNNRYFGRSVRLVHDLDTETKLGYNQDYEYSETINFD